MRRTTLTSIRPKPSANEFSLNSVTLGHTVLRSACFPGGCSRLKFLSRAISSNSPSTIFAEALSASIRTARRGERSSVGMTYRRRYVRHGQRGAMPPAGEHGSARRPPGRRRSAPLWHGRLPDGRWGDRHKNPIRVVAFNTAEGWSRDVSSEIAHGLRHRRDLQRRDVPFFLHDFVDGYEGRYRDYQLPLPIRLV